MIGGRVGEALLNLILIAQNFLELILGYFAPSAMARSINGVTLNPASMPFVATFFRSWIVTLLAEPQVLLLGGYLSSGKILAIPARSKMLTPILLSQGVSLQIYVLLILVLSI